jgi:hypothetical protein
MADWIRLCREAEHVALMCARACDGSMTNAELRAIYRHLQEAPTDEAAREQARRSAQKLGGDFYMLRRYTGRNAVRGLQLFYGADADVLIPGRRTTPVEVARAYMTHLADAMLSVGFADTPRSN